MALRERIIKAFEVKAFSEGPSSVSLGCMAKELDIDTATLFKIFPTKSDILVALIRQLSTAWEYEQERGIIEDLPPRDRIERHTLAWLKLKREHGPIFWQQLRDDFHEVYKLYQSERKAYFERAKKNLGGAIRDDLTPLLALSNLLALLKNCSDYAMCERVGVNPEDAIKQAIDMWAKGALK